MVSIGPTLHLPAAGGAAVGAGLLGEGEAVGLAAGLGHHEHRQALVGEGLVGVGAGQEHEHVGPGAEGAPGLHAVDEPAALGGGGGDLHAGHVGAVVGLGDGHGGHDLGRGELGQPLLLLLLGAAGEQGPGEDLGPGDERAAGAERGLGQLLGGDDHADVLALAALGVAVVLDRHREAEAAELGEAADELLGDVGVLAVDVLGDRGDLVLGEAAEGVLHHLEVAVEVAGAGGVGERGQELRGPVGGDELTGAVEHARLDAPLGLAAEQLGHELADGVGDVGAGDLALDLALGAVGRASPGRSRPWRRRGPARRR